MAVKLTGTRSLETKLMRLACELRDDARRVDADRAKANVASSLNDIAQLMSNTADAIRRAKP